MSDLDSYVNHCYDVLLHAEEHAKNQQDAELCACSKLLKHNEQNQ